MTALPKKKHSRGRKHRKLSHSAIKRASYLLCSCGRARLSHRACSYCGTYGDRVIPGIVREKSSKSE